MCFFLNNGMSMPNSCCNPRPVCPNVFTSATTQYIQGPAGPTGPVGPAGAAGVSDGVYVVGGTQAVNAGQTVPLALGASTPTTQATVSGNAVTVPAGTYLVSFGGTAASSDATSDVLGVSLYASGATVPNGQIEQSVSDTVPANVSKTLLYTAASATSFTLVNTSQSTMDFTDAFITILRLV